MSTGHQHTTERVTTWKSTSLGWPDRNGLHRPHKDSADKVRPVDTPLLLPDGMLHEIEETLDATATGASVGTTEGDPGSGDPFSDYVNDVRKIARSPEFLRLGKVMQVLPGPQFTTRRDHSVRVARLANYIAIYTHLNPPAVVARALVHDSGHFPCAHATEYAMSRFANGVIPEIPGSKCDHALIGADVVLPASNMNLTEETLRGVRHHTWSLLTGGTNEDDVISIADRDYVGTDIRDALVAGLIDVRDLPDAVHDVCGCYVGDGKYTPDEIADMLSMALAEATIEAYREHGVIGLPREFAAKFAEIRQFAGSVLLPDWRLDWQTQIAGMTGDLVEHLATDPRVIGEAARKGWSPLSTAVRRFAKWTDDDAFRYAKRYMGVDVDRLRRGIPRGIDVDDMSEIVNRSKKSWSGSRPNRRSMPVIKADRARVRTELWQMSTGKLSREPITVIAPGIPNVPDFPPVSVQLLAGNADVQDAEVQITAVEALETIDRLVAAARRAPGRLHISIEVGGEEHVFPGPRSPQFRVAILALHDALGRSVDQHVRSGRPTFLTVPAADGESMHIGERPTSALDATVYDIAAARSLRELLRPGKKIPSAFDFATSLESTMAQRTTSILGGLDLSRRSGVA